VPGTNELKYFAANYRQVLTSEGLFAFINSNYAWGRPDSFTLQQVLGGFHTRSLYVESGLAQPVIRQREKNLTLSGLIYASNNFSDFDMFTPSAFNRDHIRGLRAKADADWADRFLGINQVNVTVSHGFEGFGSSQNNVGVEALSNVNLLSNAFGRVDFTKVEATVSRTQPLFGPFSAFGSIYGQYAGEPLLVSEQCGYGGRFFGRAYDPSQLLGDHCVEAIVEFRYDVPKWTKAVTQTQFYTFGDYGKLWVLGPGFVDPTTGGISANAVGASAGGGVRLAFWDSFTTDLQVAKAVHGIREDTRFFFVIGAKY